MIIKQQFTSTSPIRVLQVVGSIDIGGGGIQSFIQQVYKEIDYTKIQFDFVVHMHREPSYENEIINKGGRVYYIEDDAFEKRDWLTYIHFWKNFFKDHPEYRIVHGHLRSTASIYLYEAKKAGCITIAHSHATNNGYGISAIVKDVLQFPIRYIADYFMGCSKQANDWMFGKRVSNNSHCYVIKNGIDSSKFVFDPQKRRRIRELLEIDDDTFVIGTVGRLVPQKNQELLINALPSLVAARKVFLLIVGNGPLYRKLQERINLLELNHSACLLGSRNDVDELLQGFDCFAMPSRDEGLGISIIEAQAADLPVVVSPAISEEACITDTIIRANSFDVLQWADLLAHISEKQRTNKMLEIKAAGYDINEVANRLCDFYYRCIGIGDAKW